ncbi:AAA family ATPase [Streptomyces uncialis]|uniref:AAA family ATPase n=1 Tax=Streptomyces uncialis TaxID=1048205 RepID=UPI0037BE17EE|nr:ATP-binding protein [Streptomyces uncialis]
MQHAGGAPLPPPERPGGEPAAGWPAPHHPGTHRPGTPHPGPVPTGPPPPGPYPSVPPPPHSGHAAPPPPSGPPPAPHPHQGPPPAPHSPPHQAPPPPPTPQQGPPQRQGPPPPPAPRQGPPPHSPPHQGAPPHPAPRQAPAASAQAPGGPPQARPDSTGHVRLPPGGPVALPSPPPAHGGPDTTGITLAVLLIGPAGAGKTSVAKYWAEHRRAPTAHISLDDVREWVRSGFADPQSGWNDHSEAQYRLARRTCGFAARNFLANGISCILDDAVFPDRPVVGLGGWKRHVGPGLLPVVLLPGLEIVLERNAERSGNRRLADEEVARIHGRMAGWYGSGLPIIDNSHLDIPSTAQALTEALTRSVASPPQW